MKYLSKYPPCYQSVLLESRLTGNQQVEQSHVINEVTGTDDVKRDVIRQPRVADVERVARPERRGQLQQPIKAQILHT